MENIRIQTTVTQKGRRIIGRILPGSDLIQGVKKLCREHNVRFGIIISIIGSLRRSEFICPLPDISNIMGIRYSDPVQIEGPIELLSCQGTVGLTEEGDQDIHMHAVISDPTMRVYGGHLLDKGNPVLGTGEILIQECDDAKILRVHDEETGFMMFKFYPNESK
jgi:predicted DNA-binding protein with PD1-like motif